MKGKIALRILAGVLAFIVADNWPTPRGALADAFICDDLCRALVDFYRGAWGSDAEVYWNNQNFVVISKDGYVSEFKRTITTKVTRPRH